MRNFLTSIFIASAAAAIAATPNAANSSESYKTKLGAAHRIRYSAATNSQVKLNFKFYVEFRSPTRPKKSQTLRKIDDQIVHLYGPMAVTKPLAAPRGIYDIQLTTTEKIGPDMYRAEYTYSGLLAMQLADKDEDRSYEVTLPIRPGEIYKKGIVNGVNVCTDPHYNSEGDFWYFWNPKMKNCPLVKDEDYRVIATRVVRYKNNATTYPEYERLVNPETKEIYIAAFFGMDDPDSSGSNPQSSKDVNADNFKLLRNFLVDRSHFTEEKWTAADTKQYLKKLAKASGSKRQDFGKIPYVEEFTKETPHGTIRVRAIFGATGIDERAHAFHHFYKEAVETAAIIDYDGHSGLGSNLDIDEINTDEGFQIEFAKNLYQIFFFNSCSSFSYYNDLYFAHKVSSKDPLGTKNLDIIAAGLETAFVGGARGNVILIQAIYRWATKGTPGKLSYQELAKKMDSGNLLGINGDQDNPKNP